MNLGKHHHHHHGGGGGDWGGPWGGWGYGGPIILTYPMPEDIVSTDEFMMVSQPEGSYGLEGRNGLLGLGDPAVSSNVMSFIGAMLGAHFGSQKDHPMIGAAVGYMTGIALGNILGR